MKMIPKTIHGRMGPVASKFWAKKNPPTWWADSFGMIAAFVYFFAAARSVARFCFAAQPE